ncbi:MAG TPA: hypothetical protein VFN38_09350 [Gemmatimonadaceae bacterium]|nr:hypothetical protein [Gemmatimonadaceae bacterium]
MTTDPDRRSRRDFVLDVGRLATAVAVTASVTPHTAQASVRSASVPRSAGDWDLSWIDRLAGATDRAVFDWPDVGDPSDPTVLEIAERYLDGCTAVYGSRRHETRVILNIRHRAVPAALDDAAWERFALGAEYGVKDPASGKPAVRNPFWRHAASAVAAAPEPYVLPTIEALLQRGAIVLVCDFALSHLASRLASRANRSADDVHRELRGAFVPGSYAVPSGIFGLARAQNAGCAYMRA